MKDPRMGSLAALLVNYSCALQQDEKILIETFDTPEPFTVELVRESLKAGGIPFVSTKQNVVLKSLYQGATEAQMKLLGDIELYRMKQMTAYIGVRGSQNIAEMSDVDLDKLKVVNAFHFKPVHLEQRVKHTKWTVLRWPTPSMAQQANMGTEAFEDFFFRVCTLDYARMSRAMDNLVEWMQKTDRIRIKGPGTNLTFSIANIPAKKCDGRHNIPDGEVYTAPVRDSVNGEIHFNAPTIFLGFFFNDIRLEFKDGKVIRADAGSPSQTEQLNKILSSDEGARYVGEFAIGLNPHITRPMKDILFDEKIAGSFHLALGQAYEQAENGNRSQIHWDLVSIQTDECGGGEIHFDGILMRENGLFVRTELEGLNPARLK